MNFFHCKGDVHTFMCLKTKVMFSSSTSAGSGYISTDMIMEFSTLITKTTKILNEVLNSFEANKYVNKFIVNKKNM